MDRTISPSRTYVAIFKKDPSRLAMFKDDLQGYFFIKFILPQTCENDSYQASWYFLNHVNIHDFLLGCITFEDYSNIKEEKEFK